MTRTQQIRRLRQYVHLGRFEPFYLQAVDERKQRLGEHTRIWFRSRHSDLPRVQSFKPEHSMTLGVLVPTDSRNPRRIRPPIGPPNAEGGPHVGIGSVLGLAVEGTVQPQSQRYRTEFGTRNAVCLRVPTSIDEETSIITDYLFSMLVDLATAESSGAQRYSPPTGVWAPEDVVRLWITDEGPTMINDTIETMLSPAQRCNVRSTRWSCIHTQVACIRWTHHDRARATTQSPASDHTVVFAGRIVPRSGENSTHDVDSSRCTFLGR